MTDQTLMEQKVALLGETLLCGALGRMLYGSPDRSWLDGLIAEDVFADVPFGADQPETQAGVALLSRWTNENRAGLSDSAFKALEADHMRLFIGLDHVLAPVWESVYCNERRLVFQEQTLQVRQWYSRFGLQAEHLYREPDDHIGLELSFMAHLASQALQALEADDQPSFDELMQAQRDFLTEHPLRWGPAWAKLVIQHAGTDFYRGIGHLVLGALLAMARYLRVELPAEAAR